MDSTEKLIIKTIEKHREEILAFARDIYSHGELGYREYRTSEKFQEVMKKLGLRTETGLAITGAKAYLNEDRKDKASLALLGEMDALLIPDHPYADPQTGVAHCCGHNAQLAGVIGAAMALTVPEVAEKLEGQLVFFAVPAEEYGEIEFKSQLRRQGKIRYGGGKCELIRIGAFDDIDMCLAHHIRPGENILTDCGSNNGFVSKVITYHGRAAHAADAPEKGINALAAASIGLQALGLARETFRDEDCVRVHPIVTKGGSLVNVIPDEVVVETMVRGKTLEAFSDAARKTDRCFMAGALATGAEVQIDTAPGYLPQLPMEELKEFRQAAELAEPDTPIVPDFAHTAGSSDVGDLQHLMPVYTFRTGGVRGGLHQADYEVVDEEQAYLAAAEIFALTAYNLLKDGAARCRELADSYEPVFKKREEYIRFMDSFDSHRTFSEKDLVK